MKRCARRPRAIASPGLRLTSCSSSVSCVRKRASFPSPQEQDERWCYGSTVKPRFALAQIEVKPGRPDHNVASMLAMVGEAKKQGAHLVVFPEMCVGGYLLGDRFLDDAYTHELMRWNQTLI